MRRIFADTSYWVALLDIDDELHAIAKSAETKERQSYVVTTDAVLVEVLNYFSAYGPQSRVVVAKSVEALFRYTSVSVIAQTADLFLQALQFYKSRSDKQYSLTDCMSMVVMRREQIFDALTSDHHFEQEGFNILMR